MQEKQQHNDRLYPPCVIGNELPAPQLRSRYRFSVLPSPFSSSSGFGRLSGREARLRILVADDDEQVCDTYAAILGKDGYDVVCAGSTSDALRELAHQCFDIMLSDLFVPGQNGLEMLKSIHSGYPDMPVILITAVRSVEIVRQALQWGASDFLLKPCNVNELPIIVERNLTRQAVHRRDTLHHHLELQSSNETVLDALLTAVDTRDTETQGHSERVTAYTIEMADRLSIPLSAMLPIERGALLHDIGKIGIPDRILLKSGKLTEEEWVEMRKHPLIGYEMCIKIPMLAEAARIVLHHHEAWDGGGYPHGLLRDQIPIGARIFAIADTLDAMTSDRPYRAALPFGSAQTEIERCSGTQFDPDLVKLFLSISEERWNAVRTIAA